MSSTQTTGGSQAVANGATTTRTLQNYVGGRWVDPDARTFGDIFNPATGERIARVPLGTAADLDRAVQAALRAFPGWRQTPPVNRVKPLFKLKELLERHFDDIAATVTREHGKTLDESRSSVRRAIDNVDLAIGAPTRMMGTSLE